MVELCEGVACLLFYLKQHSGEHADSLILFRHSALRFIIKLSCLVTKHCCRGYSFSPEADENVFLELIHPLNVIQFLM